MNALRTASSRSREAARGRAPEARAVLLGSPRAERMRSPHRARQRAKMAAVRYAPRPAPRLEPSAPERSRSPEAVRVRRGREQPRPRAWERRRRRGGGETGCEWSGHFLFLCSFPQRWVVAGAQPRLPVSGGRGGVDSGPGTPRPAACSRAPTRRARARRSPPQCPPPPRPRERPRCRPSSVWWWGTEL